MNTLYLATVSYPPNPAACYVRLQMPQTDSHLPLSIKAAFSSIPREQLTEGAIVEVERTQYTDARRYRVARVIENVGSVQPAIGEKRYVRFFLAPRYFASNKNSGSNSMHRDTCVDILGRCFGPPCENGSWRSRMIEQHNGFHILCTPAQFGEFIIERYDANECINGIKDLKPEVHLCKPLTPTLYSQVAEETGITRFVVQRVLAAAKIADSIIGKPTYIDVTEN